MKKIRNLELKKCPRCKEKYLAHQKKCLFCGLVFERLNYVSNKSAKKEVIRFRKKNYLMVSDWPTDVSKKTALFLCGFLGFTGAHNFYLGRFWKGLTVLFGLVCSAVLLLLEYQSIAFKIIWYLSLIPAACVYVFWVFDFISIFFEKYKITVALDKTFYEKKFKTINSVELKKSEKSKDDFLNQNCQKETELNSDFKDCIINIDSNQNKKRR